MKIIVKQKEIEQCFNISSSVASKKTITPSLQGTLLIAKNQSLTLQSSDSEIFYSTTIPSEVAQEGSVLVKTSLFHDIIRNCMTQSLELSLNHNNNSVLVKGVGSHYQVTLALLNLDDFPEFPDYDQSQNLAIIPDKEFKEMLSQTIPFASKDDMRLVFNSIFLEKDSLEIRMITSDTKRLALVKHFITTPSNFSLLLPLKTGSILKEMLNKNTNIEISLLNNTVLFKYDDTILVSNQIAGSFPDYKAVIPNETPHILKVNKSLLSNTLKTLSPFYNNMDSQKLMITLSNNLMSLRTEESQIGKAVNDIEIDYQSDNIEIIFNYRLLNEIIQIIQSQEITIKILAADKPVLLQGISQDNSLFVCVPMKA